LKLPTAPEKGGKRKEGGRRKEKEDKRVAKRWKGREREEERPTVDFAQNGDFGGLFALFLQSEGEIGHLFAESGGSSGLAVSASKHRQIGVLKRRRGEARHTGTQHDENLVSHRLDFLDEFVHHGQNDLQAKTSGVRRGRKKKKRRKRRRTEMANLVFGFFDHESVREIIDIWQRRKRGR
jgi:hypothetical protein